MAAYRTYWKAIEAATNACAVANQNPCQQWQANPNDPALGDVASGVALGALVENLRGLRRQGLVVRGEVILTRADGTPSFSVTRVTADSATVIDCHDASHYLAYDAATGALRDVSDPRRALWTVSMSKEAGRWKVSNVVDNSKEDQGRCASQ
jgi:hypothetical protein